MTSRRHTSDNITTEPNPSTAPPPQKRPARSLADDLEAQPVAKSGPPQDARPVTPGEYLIRRFPALAQKYGAPLVEAFVERGDERRLVIIAAEDGFFAAYLGLEGCPDCPAVFDQSSGKFLAYGAGWFAETTPEALANRVRALLLEAQRACTDPHLDRTGLVKVRGQRNLNAIVQAARGTLLVQDDFWERPAGIIPCRNGVLAWQDTGLVLKPHSPDYRLRGLLRVDYDPKAECPGFKEFLNRALPADDVQLLQRVIGSFLLGRNVAQKLTILMGMAQSGKGVIARIVTELLGPANVTTLRTKSLDGRFEIGRFVSKLLLYAPDVDSRFFHEAGAHLLKAITGEDPFSPEFKNSNVTPPAKPVSAGILVGCNSRLKIHLESDRGAWERRLVVLPFERDGVSEEMQVAGLADILLKDEGSGILNWALAGLEAFILDGLKLPLNQRQRAVVNDLLSESESCTCFAREWFVRDEESQVTTKRAYSAYVRFCSTREWPPLSERKFEQGFKTAVQTLYSITQRHDLREGDRSARGWSGIMLDDHGGMRDAR
jgi:P4 family phage/plasmid primase-like protien